MTGRLVALEVDAVEAKQAIAAAYPEPAIGGLDHPRDVIGRAILLRPDPVLVVFQAARAHGLRVQGAGHRQQRYQAKQGQERFHELRGID